MHSGWVQRKTNKYQFFLDKTNTPEKEGSQFNKSYKQEPLQMAQEKMFYAK